MDRSDDALAALCEAEYPRLVGLLALQVGDRYVAEELAQETLLALCRNWSSVDNPRAWLNRVGLNRSKSWFRRRYAERRAYRRHGVSPEAVDGAEGLGHEDEALRRAVSSLPPRQRMVIALRFYEQYSVAETADAMDCAEGTVKAQTHHAIASLRAQFDPNEEHQHA